MKKAEFPKWICLGLVLSLVVITALIGCAQGSTTPSSSPVQSSASAPSSSGAVQKASEATRPTPQTGGVLRVTSLYDGTFIGYPPKINIVAAMRQVAPAIETLFRSDKSGRLVPWLATGLTSDTNAKTITVTLRKGVKFHDGTDFNAEAVKWNLDQQREAKAAGAAKFSSVDVVDESTIRITLSQWDSTVESNLAQATGMMISPTAVKKNGAEWAATHPVGTGPFEFVSWQKDVKTVFKKFDGYWQKGKPYLNGTEWLPIVDPTTRDLSFRAGEIDLILQREATGLAEFQRDGFNVTSAQVGTGAVSLIPDSANPNSPWAKLQVRQAARHAIDTQALVDSLFFGKYASANQWVYKAHWGYNSSVAGYPYDPNKAKRLLAEAGYPNGFKTKLLYITNPGDDRTFSVVQNYLKEVGIDAELDRAQQARQNQIAFSGASWEGLVYAHTSGNPDLAAVLAASFSGGKNYNQMLIPDDYLKAIQSAVTAPNFETKQKYTQEVMKLMIDKYSLLLPLYTGTDNVITRKSVHDHGFMQSPFAALWTPEDAWIEK